MNTGEIVAKSVKLRRFSNQPVAEIVQCTEPAPNPHRISTYAFEAGVGGTFSGEPGLRSRPAETSQDSTEPVSSPSVVLVDSSLLRTGGSERWAHWCLTSESASLTLMNACRVTPSLRAS